MRLRRLPVRGKIFFGLLVLLVLPIMAAAQDRIKGEVAAGGLFFLEEEHSDFFNGFLVTAGISYRGMGIQWESWISRDEKAGGPSLVLSPFYRSVISPYLTGGFVVGSEGGLAITFGGGLKILFAKFVGLRAEIRSIGSYFGAVSGGVFIRI